MHPSSSNTTEAQAFLDVLQHVLAPRLHEDNAFDEGQKVPGAMKTLRLVCKEAAHIIATHVTRLRVEPGPGLATALAAAAQRFPSLECLSIEVLGLQRNAWRTWTALTLSTAAAAGGPGEGAAAGGSTDVGTGGRTVVGQVAGLLLRLGRKCLGLKAGILSLLRIGPAGNTHRPPASSAGTAATTGSTTTTVTQRPVDGSTFAGTKQQERDGRDADGDPAGGQPSLAHLLHALHEPSCQRQLLRLRHLSVQLAPPGAERASCQATAALVAALGALPQLHSLRLLRTTTSPEALQALNGLSTLQHLALYNCDMSQGLGALTRLTRLDVGMGLQPCSPALLNLSPVSNLRELRALGWLLDAPALAQLSAMPHLTCLEAARFADPLLIGALELPSTLPTPLQPPQPPLTQAALTSSLQPLPHETLPPPPHASTALPSPPHHPAPSQPALPSSPPAALAVRAPSAVPPLHLIRLTDLSLQGLHPGTIELLSDWCGKTLRTIPELTLHIAASSPPTLTFTLDQLALLGKLLGSCRVPHLGLSCQDAGAKWHDSRPRSSSYQVPHCLMSLSAALSVCLPTPLQQRQVQTLSVIGMDLGATDIQALAKACGWCREVKLRQCTLTQGAWEQLHLLPCPALELWRCNPVSVAQVNALLDRLWALPGAKGSEGLTLEQREAGGQEGGRQEGGRQEAGRQVAGALRYLCLRGRTCDHEGTFVLRGASGAVVDIMHC